MGNRLSSPTDSGNVSGAGDGEKRTRSSSTSASVSVSTSTSSLTNNPQFTSTWLLKKLEKKKIPSVVMTIQEKRRRLSSTKEMEPRDSMSRRGKPHSLSEATTLSIGDPYMRGCSSSEGSDEDNNEDDDDRDEEEAEEEATAHDPQSSPPSRRSSLWQQLMGRVLLTCCGSQQDSSPSPSPLPHHRKRRRRQTREPSIAEIEEKHRAFWALVQNLLAMNDVVAMIRELQDYLVDHVGASQSAVFLVDPNHSSMSRVIRGQETLTSISQQRGLVGHVISTKTALCHQLFAQDLSYDSEIDLPQASVFQKLICVPLMENNNVYAAVQLTTKDFARSDDVDELDMKLVSWLGPILSSCMRKCIEYHDVLLSDRTQKALLHIISSSDTEDTVLNLVDGVITGASHITKSERLSLFMVDWETEELWTLSSSFHEETIRVPLEGSTLGYAARHRLTLNIADAQNDPRFINDLDQKRGIATRCALYVPVGIENGMNCDQHSRPMAVLEILNKDGSDSFSLDDECAFEAFASEVAVILRRRSNEIEYIKLLADTRAEKVLAQRAKSQVNLLECYTEYVANANTNHAAERLRHSFFKSHSKGCMVCTADQEDGTAKCTSIDRADVEADHTNGDTQLQQQQATTTVPPLINVQVGSPRHQIPAWDFNIFATDAESLPGMVLGMFLDFGILDILHTDETTLRNFVFAVKETYHPNPFHNYLHAVSVVHMAYTILKTTDAATMLQPLDVAACLIAAYCHDVDHPGHTNSYEIISKSPLAMLYSDESVLERHHACTTFRILFKDKHANILQNLATSDFRYLRKMVVTAILSTDMAQHFKMCESMEKMLHPVTHHKPTNAIGSMASKRESNAQPPPPPPLPPKSVLETVEACMGPDCGIVPPLVVSAVPSTDGTLKSSEILNVVREAVFQVEASSSFSGNTTGNNPTTHSAATKALSARVLACSTVDSCTNKSPYQCGFNGSLDERTFLVKSIVHASDLCGQTFPKPIALKWSNMISKEFAYQALLEQAENLPVSFQHLDDPLQMVEGQHFFAHKIVFPLWSLMHQMFPELEQCVANVSGNVAHYEHEIQRLKKRQHDAAAAAAAGAATTSEEGDSSPLGGGCSIIGGATTADAAMWSHCDDDEGMAVRGLARCTPAKFNSFRAMKGDSSMSRSVSTSALDDATLFGATAIEAIELSRARSEFCRSRSSSTFSSADGGDVDHDDDEDEEILEIGDLDSPELLPEAGMPLR